jgi:hypothetical protein
MEQTTRESENDSMPMPNVEATKVEKYFLNFFSFQMKFNQGHKK